MIRCMPCDSYIRMNQQLGYCIQERLIQSYIRRRAYLAGL